MPNHRNPSTPIALRFSLILIASLALLALATCGKDSPTKPSPPQPPPPPPVQPVPTRITITPATVSLTAVGQTRKLTASVLDQNGQPIAGANVSWSSSSTAVATVTSQGLVTAVMNGTAQITARAGNASASVTVTVAQSAVRITISPPSATLMAIAETVQLTAAVLDQNGQPVEGAVVTWSSSDEAVATVSPQGLVTAVMNGAAQITARAGNVSTSIDVTVMQEAGSIVIEPEEATLMAIAETVQLTAAVLDQNGQPVEGAVVTWSSSDEAVATVSPQGDCNSPPSRPERAARGGRRQITARGRGLTVSPQGLVNGAAQITARAGTASASVTVTVMDPSRDREALVALYQATNGPNWSNSENWLSDAPLDEWHGISTDYLGRVVRVNLGDNHLNGSIPPEMGQLQNLEFLAIYNERLPGPIPPEIGELRSLRELRLVNNDTTGPIPPEIGQLKNLEVLRLDRNLLTGLIPSEIFQLKNLEELALNANRLSGPIPPEIGQLKNLHRLYLGDGGLTGPIPAEIAELQNLELLEIYNNRLAGPIPPEIGELRSLRVLELSHNEITGPIPPEIGQLKNLELLSLGGNQMTGPIPPAIGQLENLRRLYLGGGSGGNQMTGPIPPAIGQLKNLESLWLGNNPGLSGSLPESMTMLTKLKELEIGNTQLCVPPTVPFQMWYSGIPQRTQDAGVICSSPARDALIALYDVTNGPEWTLSTNWTSFEPLDQWHGVATDAEGEVTSLVLEDNNLSGLLPTELGNLTRLKTLDLSFNMGLTGVISTSFTQLNLVELKLEGTQVCAPPDAEFQQWLENIPQPRVALCTDTRRDYYALAALYSVTNGPGWTNSTNWLSDEPLGTWHGVQTDTDGKVLVLGLAENGLRGPLPPEIGELRSLRELVLSNNEITGPLPPEIGELRSLRELEIFNAEITGPLPPEIGELRSLRELRIYNTEITGPLSPEIGQLENLRILWLGRSQLTGPLPPEILQLRNLTSLDLWGNRLTGSIPSEIGRLHYLSQLNLGRNQLTGPLPPEIGQLENLGQLNLSENQLTGPLPPEIGQLENLRELNISENQLTGPLPPEIGQLENLRELNFSENRLTGAIPSEFGELNMLEEILLSSNLLTGNIPDTIGDLASLRVLNLTGNTGMSGALPVALTRLNLEMFLIGGTSLCAPEVAEFQEWLRNSPNVRIMRCDSVDGKSVAYLVQATQSLDNPVPLIAGEGALLRVFLANGSDIDVELPLVKATFYHSDAEVYAIEIPGNESPIPRRISEGDLSSSANARIPGSVLMPGLEMVVEVDPDGELDPALGLTGRLPESGRMAIDVRSMPLFDLTLVPFLWTEDPDRSILTRLEELTPESDLFRFTRDILPVGEFHLTVREPVWTSFAPRGINAQELIRETEAIHAMDGASGHYMGILQDGGLANLGGKVSVSPFSNSIMAHELGHNMSLPHAPCGDPPGPDPNYPYPDGIIGVWGYDQDYDVLVNPNTQDLMSYCSSPHWISDYNFTKAMNYRLQQEQATSLEAAFAPSVKSLLLWGGINGYGELVLEPAFAVDAPASPPLLDGPYRLTGLDTGGGALFSFSFGMAGIADGEGASFAFILPVQAIWASSLQSITLSGPEGVSSLDGEDDPTAAILLDSGTGKVRGLLRDWPVPSTTLQAARRSSPEPGIEVIISTGVPDAADWDR